MGLYGAAGGGVLHAVARVAMANAPPRAAACIVIPDRSSGAWGCGAALQPA